MFAGLINETALLESLGWDEEAYGQLIEFIEAQQIVFTPTHPTVFLNQVEEFFGEPTRIVLEEIMKTEYEKIKDRGNHEN